MKFSVTGFITKLTAACSTDKSLPALHDPHFDADLKEIQATNKYVAARIPVDPERGDTTGPVAVADVKAAVKAKSSSLKTPKRGKKKEASKFPSLVDLWPGRKEIEQPAFEIGLNVDLLKDLADSLGAKNGAVRLIFPRFTKDGAPQALRPVVVQPLLAKHQGEYFGADFTPREDGDGVAVPEGIFVPYGAEFIGREDTPKNGVKLPEGVIMPVRVAGATASGTPKAKAAAAKKNGGGTVDRSAAARKAVETRRLRAAAAGKTTTTKPGKADSKPTMSRKEMAAAIRATAGKPKTTATSGRSAKNGKTKTDAGFGKGSDARRQAALKAAATRRAKAAA